MTKHNRPRAFTTECIREFSLELAGMALRAGAEAGLFARVSDEDNDLLFQTGYPAITTFRVSETVFGVANFQLSDDLITFGRVKYFCLDKMAWRNEDPSFDDHTPIATVEFFYDQRQRQFICGSGGPTLRFQVEAIDEICGIGVLPPYKTPRR